MGNGMNKILPGLYVGSFRDAKDRAQLESNGITHILSIHDNAKPLMADKEYLCIHASDHPSQDLTPYFSKCIDFIHKARIKGGSVLVHCIAGVSRSVTVTVAYIMTVTSLGWRDALNSVRGARHAANPNFGFQRQLLAFQHDRLEQEKRRVLEEFPPSPHDDLSVCRHLLDSHQHWVIHGDHKSGLNPETDLYNLPYGAYNSDGSKDSANTQPSSNGTTMNDPPPKDMNALDRFFEVNDRFQKNRLEPESERPSSSPLATRAASHAERLPSSPVLAPPEHINNPAGSSDTNSNTTTKNTLTVDEMFATSQTR